MNSLQAKQLSLPQILAKLGHQPVKSRKGGYELWYCSPFRQEKEPSFVTSYLGGKWIWNDFGDIGGTVIDFIMRHENLRSVKEALSFLEDMFREHRLQKPVTPPLNPKREDPMEQPNLFSFNQQGRVAAPRTHSERELEFLDAHAISNPVIYQYLEKERCIPKELASRYLLEIKYRNIKSDKEYFAFGMRNESDGFEIRAASSQYSFKSALKIRDISLIRGQSKERRSVNIFEGMTDFLSLMVMYNCDQLSGDSIIMHSLSSFKRTQKVIEREGYKTIYTFLDNNRAGQGGTDKFQKAFSGKVQSQSDLFVPHIDLNDALVANSR